MVNLCIGISLAAIINIELRVYYYSNDCQLPILGLVDDGALAHVDALACSGRPLVQQANSLGVPTSSGGRNNTSPRFQRNRGLNGRCITGPTWLERDSCKCRRGSASIACRERAPGVSAAGGRSAVGGGGGVLGSGAAAGRADGL